MQKTVLWTVLALVTVAAVAGPATAQNRTAPAPERGWHEAANELGYAQAKFQDIIDGSPASFEARFYLNTLYTERGVTYFLFALDAKQTPLKPTFVALVNGADGSSIPVYRTEEESGGKTVKWYIDAANMPPAGSQVLVKGTIDATGTGQYMAGALLIPFNYRWEQVSDSQGTPVSLYIGTQYGINSPTQAGCDGALCGAMDFVRNPTPSIAVVAAVAVLGAAAVAMRRRR